MAGRKRVVFRPAALSLALASVFAVTLTVAQTSPGGSALLPYRGSLKPAVASLALPVGGAAVIGQANFDSSKPNVLWVTTQNGAGTRHSVINWQSFSIGAGNSTYFQQPDAASTSINRVVSNTPSEILGTLGSNGKLVLVNQSGIAVGAGAAVDTAGFTASTLALSESDAAAGRLRFGDPAAASTMGGAAGITVQGQIVARQGDVVLVAPMVETGAGALIRAPNGSAVLAAGQQVEISGRGLEGISMRVQAPTDKAVNLGSLQGDAVGIFAGTLVHSGAIKATRANLEGGRVVLLAGQSADISGAVSASGNTGGSVQITVAHSADPAAPGVLVQTGVIEANGSGAGGSVRLAADSILSSAAIQADGSTGGQIAVQAANRALSTTAARYSANGAAGQGGDILVAANVSNYSSGSYSATGTTGGQVALAGAEIKLAGAQLDVSGTSGGGDIHVGGLMHGAAGFEAQGTSLANASTVLANGSSSFKADARQSGNGGEIVLWSDQTLRFGGSISAKGGADAGDGGRAEVSGLTALAYKGSANLSAPKGAAGTLLLDPKNISIVAGTASLPYLEFLDPTPGAAEGFGGASNVVLPVTGNIVATSPNESFVAPNAGAVYLYTPTGSLLSALVGSHAGDAVGSSGVSTFSNGNYLVRSPSWSNPPSTALGAVTWMDGGTGALSTGSIGGTVDGTALTGNSLVGSSVGANVQVSGNVALAVSPGWTDGAGAIYTGAVTWLDGSSGRLADASTGGPVSAANSLVGGAAWDQVGIGGITWGLAGGNIAIASSQWGSGGIAGNALGAVTWMKGADGHLSNGLAGGQISGANSLIGAAPGDKVGLMTYKVVYDYATAYPSPFSNDDSGVKTIGGNLLIGSNNWNGQRGAATWMNGSTGALSNGASGGVIDGTAVTGNSLVGTAAGDRIGTVTTFPYGPQTTVETSGLVDLGNSNFLLRSGQWGSGGVPNSGKGAVTWWGDNAAGVVGPVGPGNSIVGSIAGDRVGAGWTNAGMNDPGVVVLPNSNYVVVSSDWGGGKGAVTWGDGNNGTTGVVSGIATAGNASSLVGSVAGDHVGSQGIQVQTGGSNFAVKSPQFSFNSLTNNGAVTWMNGDTGAFSNGSSVGAVDGTNSLMGSTSGDGVGGNVVSLNSGNFLAFTPSWNGGKGAVTWLSGSTGKLSDGANGGPISDGVLTTGNSLVGSTQYDMSGIPSQGGPVQTLTQLGNNHLVIATPQWSNPGPTGFYWDARGAVTWMNGTTGKLSDGSSGGAIGNANSLVGASTGDQIGVAWSGGIVPMTGNNNNLVIQSQFWNNPTPPVVPPATLPVAATWAGAATWMNGANGKLVGGATGGTVSNTNSLVGTHTNDQAGLKIWPMGNGHYIVSSYLWGDGVSSQVGAVTWGNGATGTVGDIGNTNSLVGAFANDNLGNSVWPNQGIEFFGGNYLVRSNWNGGMGSLTWVNGNNGQLVDWTAGPIGGVVSASNSLVGSSSGDGVGRGKLTALNNGKLVLENQYWGGGKGAVTWLNPGNGTLFGGAPFAGVISAGNSLVGSVNDAAALGGTGDRIGSGGVTEVTDQSTFSNYVVASPDWVNAGAEGAGAVTFANGASGRVGVVTAGNSLVGTLSGDRVGSWGVHPVTDNASFWNYFVHSPDWGIGNSALGKGAVTWMNGQTGALSTGALSGAVGPANSLVGSIAGDQVGVTSTTGLAGLNLLGNGNLLLRSEGWNGGFSALTWLNGANGRLSDGATGGAVSASNSLLGSAVGDNLGASEFGVTQLNNGNLVVASPSWSGGGAASMGAVSWINGANGSLADASSGGVVSATNSLVGSAANDRVGLGYCPESCDPGIYALSGGNYVVNSFSRGAVSYGSGTAGIVGVVSGSNSLLVATQGISEIGTSGKVLIGNAAANLGKGGLYLLGGAAPSAAGPLFTDSPAADASFSAGSIAASLDSGTNVVLQANTDLTQVAGANISATGTGSLTLQAGRSLVLNGGVSIAGALSLTANDPGAMAANRAAGTPVLDTTTATLAARSLSLSNSGGDILTGAMSASNGAINLSAANTIVVGGAMSTSNGTISTSSASLVLPSSQSITSSSGVIMSTDHLQLDGVVNAGGLMQLQPLGAARTVLISAVDDVSRLSLTAAEFNNITANELQLMSPGISFETPVAASHINILQTGTNVTVAQPLSLTQANSAIDFNADKIDLSATVSAGSKGVYLGRNGGSSPNTLAYQIGFAGAKPNLPTNALELSTAELQRISTTGPLFIGDIFNAGSVILNPLQVVGPIDLSSVTGKLFLTGSSVSQAAGATIKVPQLAVIAAAGISLTQANQVGVFAGRNSAPASSLAFNNAGALTVGTVTGGISNWSEAGIASTGTVALHSPGIALNASVTAAGAGDALVLDAGAGNFSNTVGASALAAPNGRWLVYSTNPANDSRGGLGYDFKQYGIVFGGSVLGANNGFLYSLSPAAVNPSLTGTAAKTYDGSSALASLAGLSVTGAGVDGDIVNYNYVFSAASYVDANAGAGKIVNASGVSGAAVARSNTGKPVYGYTVNPAGATAAGVVGSIDPAALTVSSSNVSKTYDGTTSAAGSAVITSGILFGNDTLSGGSFAFVDKNAGTGKSVNLSGVTVNDGNGGANYSLSLLPNTSSSILAATINLVGNRIYDGTTVFAAAAFGSAGTIKTGIAGENLLLTGSGSVASRNVAAGTQALALGSLSLANGTGLASNYSLARGGHTGTVSTLGLKVVDLTGLKVYDGTPIFGFAQLGVLPASVVAGDTVALVSGSATVASKNAGHYSAFVSNTLALGGPDAANYSLIGGAVGVDITPASLTASSSNVVKSYDGTTGAAGTAIVTAGTLFAGDSLSGGSFAFTDRNAGTGKTVTVAGISVNDGNGGLNYRLSQVNNSASSITAADLAVSSSNVVKTYDGTTGAAGTAIVTAGTLFAGDSLNGGSFAFADKNVGTGKTVTVAGVSVNDGNGGLNYRLSQVNNSASSITAADLGVSSSDVVKTYDGTTGAAGTAVVTAGTLFAGDSLSGGSFAFTDKNVGTGKTVTVAGINVNDGNGGKNYKVAQTNNSSSSISPASLNAVTGITAANKVEDGTVLATLDTAQAQFAGKFGADVLNVASATGAFSDPEVGAGKAVSISAIALGGIDAGNYRLLNNTASTSADITLLPAKRMAITGFVESFPALFALQLHRPHASPDLLAPDPGGGPVFASDALVVEAAICRR